MKVEKNVPIPEPAKDQVLVHVKAAGVNPVDAYIRAGMIPTGKKPPFTPGSDAAGIVEKVGANLKRFKKGDRVFICGSLSGTYAEYTLAAVAHTYELPEKVTFEQGAGLGVPYLTAYRCFFQLATLQPSQTVFVHGASGAVGLACVQLARRHGVKTVVGTAGSDEAITLLSKDSLCGKDNVFNHKTPNYVDTIKTRFPKGFDVIIEVLANVNLTHDVQLVAQRGIILVVGTHGASDKVDSGRILMTEARIQGVLLLSASEAEYEEAGRAVVESARDGTRLPIISTKFTFDQAPDAHTLVLASSKTPGKIVLIP